MQMMDSYNNILRTDVYNKVITAHGLIMIFFFLMPVLIGGFGKFLLPLLLSVPDLNLPRLKALRAWLLIPSGIRLITRLLLGNTGVG